MEESIHSRSRGAAPPNLQKETSAPPQPSTTKGKPPPHAPKQEESPRPLVIRSKTRKLLARRELHYLLVSRLLVLRIEETPLSAREQSSPSKGKALYIIFHKKRLGASSKCKKKKNSISDTRQALPSHRGTRELRLPLRWRDQTSFLPL